MTIPKMFVFSKHQNKDKFKNLDDSKVLSRNFSDLHSLNNLHGLNDFYSLISSITLLIVMVGAIQNHSFHYETPCTFKYSIFYLDLEYGFGLQRICYLLIMYPQSVFECSQSVQVYLSRTIMQIGLYFLSLLLGGATNSSKKFFAH